MSKTSHNKTKDILLVFLFLGLIITTFLLYQEKAEVHEKEEKQYHLFLNRFYFELTHSIRALESIFNDDLEDEKLTLRLTKLEKRLGRLDAVLDLGSATLDGEIKNQPTFLLYAAQSPIAIEEDKEKIDKYLKSINEVLLFIHEQMYSDETEQENPNLTAEEFNTIISKGTELYKNLMR